MCAFIGVSFKTNIYGISLVNEKEYLKPYVEVEEADGSLFSKLILFLDSSHLYNTQTLWLGWKGLHTQRL